MWIKLIIIAGLLLVAFRDANNIRFQAVAQAYSTAAWSLVSVVILLIAVALIATTLEVKHICILGY